MFRLPPGHQWTEFMEFITPDQQTLRFNTKVLFAMNIEGYGMPEINYISQQGPFQHGATIYDYRLQPRIIQMMFRESACSREEYWELRAKFLNYFRPNRQVLGDFQLGTLRRILPDGSKRDIRVTIEQGPSFNPKGSSWDEWSVHDTIRFIASDPTFYDPDANTLNGFETGEDHLILPFTFDDTDIVLTTEIEGGLVSVSYTGTWLSYPTIVLGGPIDTPIITNVSTGETIDLSAINIAEGETIVITLEYGNKTVISDVNGNMIGYVSSDSDVATFHIGCDPEVPNGLNTIALSGDNITTASQFLVSYYTRYIGI